MKQQNIDQRIKRKNMVAAGAYDGRFKSKVVTDKKKKQAKEWARKGPLDGKQLLIKLIW